MKEDGELALQACPLSHGTYLSGGLSSMSFTDEFDSARLNRRQFLKAAGGTTLVGQLPSPVRFKQPCGSSEPSECVGGRHKQ